MAELAREEMDELSAQAQKLEEKLKLLLLPKDPLDERNIMLEVNSPPACSSDVGKTLGNPRPTLGWSHKHRRSFCLASVHACFVGRLQHQISCPIARKE
jgi:hypothetical protein